MPELDDPERARTLDSVKRCERATGGVNFRMVCLEAAIFWRHKEAIALDWLADFLLAKVGSVWSNPRVDLLCKSD